MNRITEVFHSDGTVTKIRTNTSAGKLRTQLAQYKGCIIDTWRLGRDDALSTGRTNSDECRDLYKYSIGLDSFCQWVRSIFLAQRK